MSELAGVSESPLRRATVSWALFALAATAIPFLVVRFPPITDLPQHAAQARLFGEALTDPQSPYVVQWLTPYGLATFLVRACWVIFGPREAGRVAALVLALLWVGAVHWFARRRGRDADVAVLASILVFNHTLYWGFFSFQLGLPLFLVWLELECRLRRLPLGWSGAATLFAAAALLYFTHVLWFAVAALWLVAMGLVARRPVREQVKRGLVVAPFGGLAVWWFPHLAARGFTSATFWDSPGIARLTPTRIVDAMFGGLRGSAEPIVVACLLLWLAAAVWAVRRRWRQAIDRELALIAAGFLIAAIVLPYKLENTIRFGQRWMPLAMLFALLAAPVPALGPRLRRLIGAALLVGLVGATASAWIAFEAVELVGLEESLAALPDDRRLLGLNYEPESPRIAGYPTLQTFAYSQVLHGGTLNFSFADFAPCLVVYRQPRERPWTSGLEWFPRWARHSDFQYFDYVLLHGDAAAHQIMAERAGLVPVSASLPWRLYRIDKSAPRTGGAARPAGTP